MDKVQQLAIAHIVYIAGFTRLHEVHLHCALIGLTAALTKSAEADFGSVHGSVQRPWSMRQTLDQSMVVSGLFAAVLHQSFLRWLCKSA